MNGALARQTTCVALRRPGHALAAVLIEGAPGSGKSSLALTLIDRGACLVGDDSLLLDASGGRLIASPHPQTRGLLEVRNLGLLPFPVAERVPVALHVALDSDAPRFIDAAGTMEIAGIALPSIVLCPAMPALALRVELALAHYGADCERIAG